MTAHGNCFLASRFAPRSAAASDHDFVLCNLLYSYRCPPFGSGKVLFMTMREDTPFVPHFLSFPSTTPPLAGQGFREGLRSDNGG